MQTQFQYIVDLAKQYNGYSEKHSTLFEAINNLPKTEVENIFKEYGDPDRDFKPVDLLRAELARRLLQGQPISEPLVNEIKDKIRAKDVNYFNHYKEAFLKQIQEYELFKRDLFANWQNPWSVFHTFFYRGSIKETVLTYLEQIASDLLGKLDLRDYTFHIVDFQGPSNFGSTWCWLALYPITKVSHKDSYQFFILFSAKPEAGQIAGCERGGDLPAGDLRRGGPDEVQFLVEARRADPRARVQEVGAVAVLRRQQPQRGEVGPARGARTWRSHGRWWPCRSGRRRVRTAPCVSRSGEIANRHLSRSSAANRMRNVIMTPKIRLHTKDYTWGPWLQGDGMTTDSEHPPRGATPLRRPEKDTGRTRKAPPHPAAAANGPPPATARSSPSASSGRSSPPMCCPCSARCSPRCARRPGLRGSGSAILSAAGLRADVLPYALSGLLLSGIADRYPSRRVLVTCDVLSGGCVAAWRYPGRRSLLALRVAVVADLAAVHRHPGARAWPTSWRASVTCSAARWCGS